MQALFYSCDHFIIVTINEMVIVTVVVAVCAMVAMQEPEEGKGLLKLWRVKRHCMAAKLAELSTLYIILLLVFAGVVTVAAMMQATGSGQQLLTLWRVNRPSEAAKFDKHSQLANRKLLWHGTNIAVVAAILKAGLRIMPHAGGRVGRGLYLASEQAKSASYVSRGRSGKDYIGVGSDFCLKAYGSPSFCAPDVSTALLMLGVTVLKLVSSARLSKTVT